MSDGSEIAFYPVVAKVIVVHDSRESVLYRVAILSRRRDCELEKDALKAFVIDYHEKTFWGKDDVSLHNAYSYLHQLQDEARMRGKSLQETTVLEIDLRSACVRQLSHEFA